MTHEEQSNRTSVVISDTARQAIDHGIDLMDRTVVDPQSMIVIITFPISVERIAVPGSKRFGTDRGGLVSLGLIEREKLKGELIVNLEKREIAVRLNPDMMGRSQAIINFDRELFLDTQNCVNCISIRDNNAGEREAEWRRIGATSFLSDEKREAVV